MPRRLFDGPDQGLGEEVHLLQGLRPPTRGQGRCSLAVCLRLAIGYVGVARAEGAPTYGWIMALLGLAFDLKVGESFDPGVLWCGPEPDVLEALAALGRDGAHVDEPTPAEARVLVCGEIIAGRPSVVCGWGSNPREKALICGVQGQDLLGYAYDGRALERHPARVATLTTLGEPVEAAATEEVVQEVLDGAVDRLQDSDDQYRRWVRLLSSEEPYGPPLGWLDRFLGEQYLLANLIDARDAAREFFGEAAEFVALDDAEALEQAAATTEQVVTLLEALLVEPELVQPAGLADDPQWLEERRRKVEAARAREKDLRDQLCDILSDSDR